MAEPFDSLRSLRTGRSEAYAELHCCSNFTFLEGGSHPEELVETAAAHQLAALALTDRDGLYGSVRFAKAAAQRGLPGIIGAELTFEDERRAVALVEDANGYANVCSLISRGQLRGSKGAPCLRVEDFDQHCAGLTLLCAQPDAALLRDMRERFEGHLYVELQHHLHAGDARRCRALLECARELELPYVATNGVMYARKEDARLADVLGCIKSATTLEQARESALLRPNAEYFLKPPSAMARIFAGYPQAICNTLQIAERCAFRLERLRGQFPVFPVPGTATRQQYLRELTYQGAAQRYGTPLESKVERQLEYELGMIARMDLAGYFLIVWDIVRAANELGVLCQGRGSAANSAVCYALGITAVDPVGMDLLFERFMSEGREEIPDIDIDFAHQDREKIIQYVYERYGREHAAMAAEVITYHTRSAIRDVGKAIGLAPEHVEQIAKSYDAHESLPAADASGDRSVQLLVTLCERIESFPRHMGIHSGGMVITRDPLVQVAPVEWATMRDRSIIQLDKDDLQDLGLIKIDLLGLGMLSLLREAFALHRRATNSCHPKRSADRRAAFALHTIPQNDGPTYAMIQRADTIGVFQIESRAQQSMLPRMKPACFYDLVMQVAIIRPGPIQGQMIHPFLRRRCGQEAVTYPHPKLRPILERTLGVPLFQEQGMRMAIEAAGFSASEADRLRRAMGHKRSRARMQELFPKLVQGMVENGIGREAAEQLFHMLEGFADYGFPESHAASFALLAYESAYLKCHYPAIFAAAILNVQPMGFYSTEVLVNDARRHGVRIEPIAVNASEYWSFALRSDSAAPAGTLRLGFHLVRGLGETQRERLQRAIEAGPFEDLLAFTQRTQLEKEALENLAAAGAFSCWFASRREAMWALRGLEERERRGALGRLMELREPPATFAALSPRAQSAFDLWATGVSPNIQPIVYLREALQRMGAVPAAQLSEIMPNARCRVGGMVITRQRPGTAKGFVFLTLEDETGIANVIVRPHVYERYRTVIRQARVVVVEGTLQREGGCIDLIARSVYPLEDDALTAGVRPKSFS